MKKIILLVTIAFGLTLHPLEAQQYKDMMHDYTYNFYEVVAAAEKHFTESGKPEGSGWKSYMRWKTENEGKFGPTGDRSKISPYFTENGFKRFNLRIRPVRLLASVLLTPIGAWLSYSRPAAHDPIQRRRCSLQRKGRMAHENRTLGIFIKLLICIGYYQSDALLVRLNSAEIDETGCQSTLQVTPLVRVPNIP